MTQAISDDLQKIVADTLGSDYALVETAANNPAGGYSIVKWTVDPQAGFGGYKPVRFLLGIDTRTVTEAVESIRQENETL